MTCQILKNCFHPINHVSVLFTQWNRQNLHFSCFFEKQDFELKFLIHVRFWNEKNATRQILISKFYNASYFELKFLHCVRFQIEIFTTRLILNQFFFKTRQIFNKNALLESMSLKKKYFKKSSVLRIWRKIIFKNLKKNCTQKITFWFNLPSKRRKFNVLNAI